MPTKYENLTENTKDISLHVMAANVTNDFDEGYCRGLTRMWGQAVLAGEVEKYYKRLDLLTRDFKSHPIVINKRVYNKLSSIIMLMRKDRSNQVLTEKESQEIDNLKQELTKSDYELIESLPAFLNGLLIYQRRGISNQGLIDHFFPSDQYLSMDLMDLNDVDLDYDWTSEKNLASTIKEDSELAINQKLESKKDIQSFYHKNIFARNAASYEKFFKKLLADQKNLSRVPVYFSINTPRHIIGFFIENNQLTIYDANYMADNQTMVKLNLDDFAGDEGAANKITEEIFKRFEATRCTTQSALKELSLTARIEMCSHESLVHLAAQNNDLKLMEWISVDKSKLNQLNDKGMAPLHLAVNSGNREVMQQLLKDGAEVNLKDSEGNTSLHVAAESGRVDIVTTLVKCGAKISERNNNKETALDIAKKNPKSKSIQSLLVKEQRKEIVQDIKKFLKNLLPMILRRHHSSSPQEKNTHSSSKKSTVTHNSVFINNNRQSDVQVRSPMSHPSPVPGQHS